MADAAPVIMWFRRDLRLADNAALHAAASHGAPVIPVFVLDDAPARPLGGAGAWWLDKSLPALGADLAKAGSPLVLRRGDPRRVLAALAKETGATRLTFAETYDPAEAELEEEVAQSLKAQSVRAQAFEGSLLTAPGSVRSGSGGAYKVFTPYWRAARAGLGEVKLTPAVRTLHPPAEPPASDDLASWGLHPTQPDWSADFDWTPGEAQAHRTLAAFLEGALLRYGEGRNLPAQPGTSRLSPHLHWGEITARQVWLAAQKAAHGQAAEAACDVFLSEIGWRDFAHAILHDYPPLAERSFQPRLRNLRWIDDAQGLHAWRRGETGYPIVDAGMRQLWRTGWMHNRVRMIVGSFLVKDLLIDWREGERWFWDCLVDADEASNALNWQWVAGTGTDAAPFFRVFNPTSQGQKFDPQGAYVRKWVPELAKLPDAHIHAPWEAPAKVLDFASVKLGRDYPRPIVDHAQARIRALAAFKETAG